MENTAENTERKELATIGDVLEGFIEEKANQIFWDRIKNLIIDNVRGISETTDGLNASERIVWHLEEKIEVILYEDESVEIFKDTKHYDLFDSVEKAYNELIDAFGAVDGEEQKEETLFGHTIEEENGDKVVKVALEDINDEKFINFYNAAQKLEEKPEIYVGENYYEARFKSGRDSIALTYFKDADPDEYYVYTVSKNNDEKSVTEYDDIDEAIEAVCNYFVVKTEASQNHQEKKNSSTSETPEKNEFGHRIGTIADKIDQLLKIGCTVKEAEEAGIKAMRFHVHFSTMKRENTSVKCWKEGNKYFAEAL